MPVSPWRFPQGDIAAPMTDLVRSVCPIALALALTGPVLSAARAAEAVTLGGNAYLAATADEDTRGPKLRRQAFGQGDEIQFKGRTVLDNGLEVGFHTEISRQNLAGSTVQGLLTPGHPGEPVRAMFVYVKSGLGTFALGEPHGVGAAAPYLAAAAPDSDNHISLPVVHGFALRNAAAQDSAASMQKMSYFTPRFGGVQFGVSFNPTASNAGSVTLNLPANVLEQVGAGKSLEFNANYKTEFKGFQVEFGGSYLKGGALTDNQSDPLIEWGATGALGYSLPRGGGDLSLAGAYHNSNCGNVFCGAGTSLNWLNQAGSKAWNVGLRYSLRGWKVGGYFLTDRRPDTFSAGLPNQNTTVFLQTSIDF